MFAGATSVAKNHEKVVPNVLGTKIPKEPMRQAVHRFLK
jgi:hypothetical protein